MPDSSYWNPKTETLPRADLRRLQGVRLASLVARAWAKSPFHRRLMEQAKVTPERVRGVDDLARLPFTTRDAWMECQGKAPPFGDMLTRPHEAAVRYHTTSGTTGRTPLR